MGEVYSALDAKLARRVAIKVLPDSLAANPDSMARFEREARALAALQHPGILAIHDFGQDGEIVYAVTELLEGSTLRHKLRHGPLPLHQGLEIAVQLADALAAAHERGIVHRDLKPGNIFILRDGRVKLLDFGLAKQIPIPHEALRERSTQPIQTGSDTEPGLLLGTVGYMAPEQVKGEAMDGRTDIFAFGCLLAELCTGQKIFKRESLVETLHAILTEEPQLEDPRVPAPLVHLMRRCLEKEPAHRFQSARDLRYALESLQALRPPSADRPSPLRPRWMLPALATALILGIGALGSALWKPATTPHFRSMTFKRGQVYSARFMPGGAQVVYAARWGVDPPQMFIASVGDQDAKPWGEPGSSLFAISPTGDLALIQAIRQHPGQTDRLLGRLAQTPSADWKLRTLAEGVTTADWDGTGQALAVVRRIDGHDRLEYPIGTPLDESSGWISHLRFDRSGRRIAYLDHPHGGEAGGGVVVLMDAKEGRRRVLSEGWSSLQGLAWSPKGDEVWFTGSRGSDFRALHAVTPSGRLRTLLTAPQDLTLQDVATTGGALLCQSTAFGGVLGKAPGEEAHLIERYRLTRADAFSEDGHWVVVANAGGPSGLEHSLFLQDLRNAQAKPLGMGTLPALTSDGKRLLLCHLDHGKWRLSVQDLPDGVPARLPFEGFTFIRSVAWHPSDQSLILCGALGADLPRIWRLGLDQSQPQPLSPEGIDPDRPFRLSPDGHWLLAALGPIFYRIDLLDLSAPPLPLPSIDPADRVLGFEDAGHILLAADQTLPAEIQSYAIATGKRRPAFMIPALGHEGALLDRTIQSAQGGSAFAGTYLEVHASLFLVEGLR